MTRILAVGEGRSGINSREVQVLIGMPEGGEREQLVRLVTDAGMIRGVGVVSAFPELESLAARGAPQVILLSEEILRRTASLAEAAHRLAVFAPVVVLASSARQSEVVSLVVSGEVDFVTSSGDFTVMAAAFVARRLASSLDYSHEFHSAWTADAASDFAEILRHEINNPLTGILGNAELLLSQLRGKLPPLSVQRLEAVVDLAVRLREKVRRLAEPRGHESVRSA